VCKFDRGGEIGLGAAEFAEASHDGIELRALACKRPEPVEIAGCVLGRQQRVDLGEAGALLVEPGA
jgi:hypothetical protein